MLLLKRSIINNLSSVQFGQTSASLFSLGFSLAKFLNVFDTNAFEGERVRLLPVKNSAAKDLIPDLEKIFAGYALSTTATAIRFVAIDRMNSVLVVTPNVDVFPEVERWLQRLDQLIQ